MSFSSTVILFHLKKNMCVCVLEVADGVLVCLGGLDAVQLFLQAGVRKTLEHSHVDVIVPANVHLGGVKRERNDGGLLACW